LPVSPPIPHNAPNRIVRINDTQRPKLEPPQVTKLGHLVLEAVDFAASVRWYIDMLGFIPSDVMCLPDGTPVGAFMRLDRGKEPTDHHTLFVATGLEPKTYEAIVPPGRTIAPWASAPAVEGARSPNPKKPHALTLIPDHPKGEGQPPAR
jgi:hypothetical protein